MGGGAVRLGGLESACRKAITPLEAKVGCVWADPRREPSPRQLVKVPASRHRDALSLIALCRALPLASVQLRGGWLHRSGRRCHER